MPKKKIDSMDPKEPKNIDEIKPRKRAVRKPKVETPDVAEVLLSEELPQAAAPEFSPMPEIEDVTVEPIEEHDANEIFASRKKDARAESIRRSLDLEAANRQQTDPSFLAPGKLSFGLRERTSTAMRVIHVLTFIISIVVIIAALALILVTISPQRFGSYLPFLNANQSQAPIIAQNGTANATPAATTTTTSATQFKVDFVNVPAPLATTIASAFANTPGQNYTIDQTTAESGLPTVSTDTLFFKGSAVSGNSQLLSFLSSIGITAQIQENDSITDDYSLSLTTQPVAVDLSAYTATANNASGVTGVAKKYCTILSNYKISSCAAVNATTDTTGLTVYYKTIKEQVLLMRIPDFASATFMMAPVAQVEDIKLVIGK